MYKPTAKTKTALRFKGLRKATDGQADGLNTLVGTLKNDTGLVDHGYTTEEVTGMQRDLVVELWSNRGYVYPARSPSGSPPPPSSELVGGGFSSDLYSMLSRMSWHD
jgi:hypothetical protein